MPATFKCLIGCLKSLVIMILVFAVLLGAGVFFVSTLTFRQLGLANFSIMGSDTLENMNLADISAKEFFDMMSELSKPQNNIIDNPFSQADKDAVIQKMDALVDGDYPSLISNEIKTDKERVVLLRDTELAALFCKVIDPDGTLADGKVGVLPQQVTIKNALGSATISIIIKLDIAAISEKLSEIPFVKLPNQIYLTSYNELIWDETNMKLTAKHKNLTTNGLSNQMLDVIIASSMVDYQGAPIKTGKDLNQLIGTTISTIINNIGVVGTANFDNTGAIVSNKLVGLNGISQGNISILTRGIQ